MGIIGFDFAHIVGPSLGGLLILWIGEGLGLPVTAPGIGTVLSLIVLGILKERWERKILLWYSAKPTPLLLMLFVYRGLSGCRS
ncbi:MAG: hypothetical protein EXR70_12015 [Deltaproteobacteria bacterium]|nr:hypothetical protein [Deltaproteobacteria bacterium]